MNILKDRYYIFTKMKSISFFDRHRKWNNKRNIVLQKVGFYGLYNLLLDIIANIYFNCRFRLSSSRYRLNSIAKSRCKDLIISLTSYPKRIGYVWMTIETLLRQDVLPEKIILYLSKRQFPKQYDDLPANLLKLQNRGLEIIFVDDDLRSHKTYYYAMTEFPDKCVLTVDDDCLYPEDMIKALWDTHLQYPQAIVGNRAKQIFNVIPRYEHWPSVDKKKLSDDLLFVGCAGILYPPCSLHKDAFDIDLIRKLAFSADDIWLSCMARLKGTGMASTGYEYHHLRTFIPGDTPLLDENAKGGNQQTVENLNQYYMEKIGKRPFVDLIGKK